jgi:hypothetical protein
VQCREHVRERYTIERMRAGYDAVYGEVSAEDGA